MTRKRFILSFVAVSFWRNSKNMGTLLFQLSLISKPKKQPYKIHIKVKDFVNYWNIEIVKLLWCINKFFCSVAAARTSYLFSKTYHTANWHLQKGTKFHLYFSSSVTQCMCHCGYRMHRYIRFNLFFNLSFLYSYRSHSLLMVTVKLHLRNIK